MFKILLESFLHNIAVVIVGFCVGFIGLKIDVFFDVSGLHSIVAVAGGWLLVAIGFLVRLWATFHFYQAGMKVISLAPQKTLITSGPYHFSRNPLYLGGNVFIFFGVALFLGSPAALLITLLHLPLVDLFIRREERQLEKDFGEDWSRYKQRVRRWI